METEITVSHQQREDIMNLIIYFFSRADCESPTKNILLLIEMLGH